MPGTESDDVVLPSRYESLTERYGEAHCIPAYGSTYLTRGFPERFWRLLKFLSTR